MGLFISYASRERSAIDSLTAALRRAHEQVWLDEELGGGDAWWRKILEEIRNCEVFIFCLSKNSLESKPCQAELRYAQALQRPILPVQIGPLDSMRVNALSSMQAIDFQNPTIDQGIQLIAAIHAQRRRLQPLPSPLPDEPPVPFAYLMRLGSTITGPELTPHQQNQLVSELKTGLEEDGGDASARRDITQLLCALRDRADVTWRTRNEVDSVLAAIDSHLSAPGATRSSSDSAVARSSDGQRDAQVTLPPTPPPRFGPGPSTGRSAALPAGGNGGYQPPHFAGPPPPLPPPDVRFGPDGGPKKAGAQKKWLIAGGAGTVILIAVAVVAAVWGSGSDSATTAATSTSTPPTATVTPGRLDSILLSAADINGVMGSSSMQSGDLYHDMDAPTTTVSDPNCRGVIDVASAAVYQGSGFTAMSGDVAQEPGTDNAHAVLQTVVSFPSSREADAFVKMSTDRWKSCAGHVLSKVDGNDTYRWSVGDVDAQGSKLMVLLTQEAANGWTCERAMGAVSNAVIDVNACGYRITTEGTQILAKMIDKART